jgi:hypothetical protein
MENGIFESSMRSFADLVAIFEYDQDGGYFYLFDATKEKGQQARAVIMVGEASGELRASDVLVRWNATEEIVGLFIGGELCAAFDQRGGMYGGNYGAQRSRNIPPEVAGLFTSMTDYGLAREREIAAESF